MKDRLPETTIDGRPLALAELAATADDHKQVVRWLWTVLLADGTRALTSAGRWQEALHRVEQHKGIGSRLLDGRQVAVLACLDAGHPDQALHTLATTQPAEPWEEDVASCLTVLCLAQNRQPTEAATKQMIHRYLSGHVGPGLAVFRSRWGLTVMDLATNSGIENIVQRLVKDAATDADGYAAHELLQHPKAEQIFTVEARNDLLATAVAAGLRTEPAPQGLTEDLIASTARALQVTSCFI
ncbi:hypothetical protein O1L60_30990 [Streptomyces diastatochromogenes]|nr:hypothetical protein [Streptomyces diastatochromogenes]